MTPPNRDALVRLSRRLVNAGWSQRGIIAGETFDFRLTPLGQMRLRQIVSMLQELGPLSEDERVTLDGIALQFAKQDDGT